MTNESGRAMGMSAAIHPLQFGIIGSEPFSQEYVDSEYIFGISEIDAQHEEIETILIELQDAAGNNNHWYVILSILDTLHEKLTFHFALEEAVMYMFSRPYTQDHCRAHSGILQLLESLMNECSAGSGMGNQIKQLIQPVYEKIHAHDVLFIKDMNTLRRQLFVSEGTNLM